MLKKTVPIIVLMFWLAGNLNASEKIENSLEVEQVPEEVTRTEEHYGEVSWSDVTNEDSNEYEYYIYNQTLSGGQHVTHVKTKGTDEEPETLVFIDANVSE